MYPRNDKQAEKWREYRILSIFPFIQFSRRFGLVLYVRKTAPMFLCRYRKSDTIDFNNLWCIFHLV